MITISEFASANGKGDIENVIVVASANFSFEEIILTLVKFPGNFISSETLLSESIIQPSHVP